MVAGWGYFLVQGVIDPLGGINSLWPLFGISNQLLAAVALCVGTTILIKAGKGRYAWVTLAAAGLGAAGHAHGGLAEGLRGRPAARLPGPRGRSTADQIATGAMDPARGARLIFNDRLDAVVAITFMVVTLLVVAASAREWMLVLTRRKPATVKEAPFVETAYAG